MLRSLSKAASVEKSEPSSQRREVRNKQQAQKSHNQAAGVKKSEPRSKRREIRTKKQAPRSLSQAAIAEKSEPRSKRREVRSKHQVLRSQIRKLTRCFINQRIKSRGIIILAQKRRKKTMKLK